jgi:hypothetical protein
MPVVRWKSVLVLAVLLAAATAVADTVITAKEAISCRVVSADTNFVRLKLPEGGVRMLNTHDIYEMRISDPGRVAELGAGLPQVRITLDSNQVVPAPAVRAHEMGQLRENRTREFRVNGIPGCAGGIDTLPENASQAQMVARCLNLNAALLECGRSDDTIAELLRDVNREAEALRALRPQQPTSLYAPRGGLLGMVLGTALGSALDPPEPLNLFNGENLHLTTCSCGCAAGGVLGYLAGMTLGAGRRDNLLAKHRSLLNDLIRRVNRAIASQL